MNHLGSSRQFQFAIRSVLLLICLSPLLGIWAAQTERPVGRSATPYQDEQPTSDRAVSWDLVVLGRIDACWVCQHGPPPHVTYTKVLAGKAPGEGQAEVGLVDVAARLLPEGGVPIYRSRQEEICYLKLVIPGGKEHGAYYAVIDLEEATPENLAKFEGGGKK
jgi:hypothetical protein